MQKPSQSARLPPPSGPCDTFAMPYDIPPLRFPDDALEPHISAETLRHHHGVIHPAYLTALNALLADNPDCGRDTVETLLRQIDDIPAPLRQQAAYLAGGHANHQFLWKILGPQSVAGKPTGPVGDLAAEIVREYGSAEAFKAAFNDAALALPTEGWAFLSLNQPRTGDLEIVILPGNGSVLPIAKPGILICDLWNHHGHDSRADWLDAFWHVVDWDVCEDRYRGLRDGATIL